MIPVKLVIILAIVLIGYVYVTDKETYDEYADKIKNIYEKKDTFIKAETNETNTTTDNTPNETNETLNPDYNYVGHPEKYTTFDCKSDNDCRTFNINCTIQCQCDTSTGQCYLK